MMYSNVKETLERVVLQQQFLDLSLSLSLSHTHTHTQSQGLQHSKIMTSSNHTQTYRVKNYQVQKSLMMIRNVKETLERVVL